MLIRTRLLVALAAAALLAAPASAQGFASAARRTHLEGDPQEELIVRVRADGRAAVLRPQAEDDGRRERFGLLLPSQVEALGHALREARLDDPPRSSEVDWPSELFDDRIYLIDRSGPVAYKGDHGPRGFRADELREAIRSLLDR